MPATVSNGSRSIVNKKHNYLRVPAYSGWSECSMVPGGTNHLLHLPLWYSWILSLEKGPSLNLFSCIPCCRLICLASLLRLKLSMKWTECLVGGGGWRWLGWEGADLSPQISAVLFVVPLCYNWYEPSALRKGLFRMVNNCCRVVGSPWFPVGSPPPFPPLVICNWNDDWLQLKILQKAFLQIFQTFCRFACLFSMATEAMADLDWKTLKRPFSWLSPVSAVVVMPLWFATQTMSDFWWKSLKKRGFSPNFHNHLPCSFL